MKEAEAGKPDTVQEKQACSRRRPRAEGSHELSRGSRQGAAPTLQSRGANTRHLAHHTLFHSTDDSSTSFRKQQPRKRKRSSLGGVQLILEIAENEG